MDIPDWSSSLNTSMDVIDKLIASQAKALAAQTLNAQQQTKIAQKGLKQANRQNKLLGAQIKQSLLANIEPSNIVAPPPGLSNQEVVAASDQVRIDAAKRLGYRRSILAGENMNGQVSNQSPSLLV